MALKSLSKGLKRFQILSKRVHKPYLLILLEVLYWKLGLGEGLAYYFDYELFLKGKKLGEYVPNTQFRKVVKRLNTPSYYPILEDKYFFHKILEGTRFRIPKNFYLVDPSGIFNLETSRYVDENEFLQKDLDGFCKSHRSFLAPDQRVNHPDLILPTSEGGEDQVAGSHAATLA